MTSSPAAERDFRDTYPVDPHDDAPRSTAELIADADRDLAYADGSRRGFLRGAILGALVGAAGTVIALALAALSASCR